MVGIGVPRRDEKPLRELGRDNGVKAGSLSVGLAEMASGKCLLLPGDHIIPNNLTMPVKRRKVLLAICRLAVVASCPTRAAPISIWPARMPVPMPRKVAPAVLATPAAVAPARALWGSHSRRTKNNDLSFYNTSDIF